MVKWCDAREKGSAAEVLLLEAMSSKESSYEDGEGEPKLVGYSVKRLSWEISIYIYIYIYIYI